MRLSDALGLTHRLIVENLPRDRPIRVLEAGGGSFTHIAFDAPRHVTVLDISPEQLARNTIADEKILGDLHDASLLTQTYDLIVCWDVLEHLSRPEIAFANMANSLAPGGQLVIGCPNLFSLKGFVTRSRRTGSMSCTIGSCAATNSRGSRGARRSRPTCAPTWRSAASSNRRATWR